MRSRYWISRMILCCLIYLLLGTNGPMMAQHKRAFSNIDKHARLAPSAIANDPEALAVFLTEPAVGDFEKVRSLYTWIIQHIAYDEELIDQANDPNWHTPEMVLTRGKAICLGYAQLFEQMAGLVGLETELIPGYGRLDMLSRPDMEQPNHVWNAVRLEGDWYLVDLTWGAEQWRVARLQGNYLPQKDYFLMPPEEFVLDHLPTLPMWQLLDSPVQPDEYMLSAEALQYVIARKDSSMDFRGQIEEWRSLSKQEKELESALQAWRFHPVMATNQALADKYMGRALRISGQIDYQLLKHQPERVLALQDSMLQLIENAWRLSGKPESWQAALYASTLRCHAETYQQVYGELRSLESDTQHREFDLLQAANEWVNDLLEPRLYSIRLKRQLEAYVLSEGAKVVR